MTNKSFLERQISPFLQVGVILGLSILLIGFTSLLPAAPYSSTAPIMPWVVICGMILFYALMNSLLSFSTSDANKYWLHSMISFAILLIAGGLLAWAASGVSIGDAGSIRWLYIVLTFGYLVFLSIVNLIKFLVKLAQRQDSKLHGDE